MIHSDMSQRWLGIKKMTGLLGSYQGEAAGAAIAAAALVFDGMTGALQRGEQRLTGLNYKTAAWRDKTGRGGIAHRLKPSRSPALSSLSIWPTR